MHRNRPISNGYQRQQSLKSQNCYNNSQLQSQSNKKNLKKNKRKEKGSVLVDKLLNFLLPFKMINWKNHPSNHHLKRQIYSQTSETLKLQTCSASLFLQINLRVIFLLRMQEILFLVIPAISYLIHHRIMLKNHCLAILKIVFLANKIKLLKLMMKKMKMKTMMALLQPKMMLILN